MGVQNDLIHPVGLSNGRGSGEEAVPDAPDVDDQSFGVECHRAAAEAGDHCAAPTSAARRGAIAWQIATASASAA